MGKILWLDCETTGLDPDRHAMIQLAVLIDIDGEVKESLNLKLRPLLFDVIEQSALEIHGYTEEEVKAFPGADEGLLTLKATMAKYVDKYNKRDKFVTAGYYVRFDVDFLRALFSKHGDDYFGGWFYSVSYDIQSVVAMEIADKGLRLENYQLATICEKFGIEIDKHDALSDITATRNLNQLLLGKLDKTRKSVVRRQHIM